MIYIDITYSRPDDEMQTAAIIIDSKVQVKRIREDLTANMIERVTLLDSEANNGGDDH